MLEKFYITPGYVGNLSIIERVADSSSDLTGSHFDDAFESSDVTESREHLQHSSQTTTTTTEKSMTKRLKASKSKNVKTNAL